METQNECQCPDCESDDMQAVDQCENCRRRTCRECTYECHYCGKTICCDCVREHDDELCCEDCIEKTTQCGNCKRDISDEHAYVCERCGREICCDCIREYDGRGGAIRLFCEKCHDAHTKTHPTPQSNHTAPDDGPFDPREPYDQLEDLDVSWGSTGDCFDGYDE